jgi:hypothetical protein
MTVRRQEKPELSFAVELDSTALVELFNRPGLIEQLQRLNAGICLAILDFHPQRLEVVRKLNNAGIPLNAWLVLPRSEGHWFNLDNAQLAVHYYAKFIDWTRQFDLRWEGVSLTIEPDIRLFENLGRRPIAMAAYLLTNLFFSTRSHRAPVYYALLHQIRRDGYEIETHQLPLIIDERLGHSNVLQRILGIVDLPSDREVLMLYSSLTRQIGPGLLWSYAPQAGCVGVGLTGHGTTLDELPATPPLTWNELHHDLLLAYQVSNRIFINNLEGCVANNFLTKIENVNWSEQVSLPASSAHEIRRLRRAIQTILYLFSRPLLVLLGIFILLVILRRIARGKQMKS